MTLRAIIFFVTLQALCGYGVSAAQGSSTPTPPPWHSAVKSASDDVRTAIVDIGVIVVTVFGVVLVTANCKRIWAAATNAAITINIPLIGNITLPARAAALSQLAPPPPDTGLPPASPGPIGRGTMPQQHFLAVATHVANLSAALQNVPAAQQPAMLAVHLQANPDAFAGLNPHPQPEVAYYRRFYSALFPSQLRMLQSLAESRDVTVSDGQAAYNACRAYGQPLSFRDWIDYPRKYGMIDSVDPTNSTAAIALTERGADFLHWASLEGRGAGDLAAQGRTA